MIVDLARNDLGRVARVRHRVGRGAVRARVPSRACTTSSRPSRRARARACPPPTSCARPSRPARSPARRRSARWRSSRSSSPCAAAPTAARSGGSGPASELELSVAIRTLVAAGDALHLHVGGAVTADSDPAARVAGDDAQGGAPAARPRAAPCETAPRGARRSLREGLAERRARRGGRGLHRRPPTTASWSATACSRRCAGTAGGPFALGEHLRRLEDGCRSARHRARPIARELEQAAHAVIEANGLATRACGSRSRAARGRPAWRAGTAPPTVLVVALPLSPWPPTSTAVISRPAPRRAGSPLAGVKTVSLAESVMALARGPRRRRRRGAAPEPPRRAVRGDDRERLPRARRRRRDAAARRRVPGRASRASTCSSSVRSERTLTPADIGDRAGGVPHLVHARGAAAGAVDGEPVGDGRPGP